MTLSVLAFALILASGAASGAPPAPSLAPAAPSVHVEKGACPFECCVYRAWVTTAETTVYARPDRSSRVVGVLRAGATVNATTGEVHSRAARFIVTRPHGPYGPGDVLWVYTYLGEGRFRVWWNGAMREEDLEFSPYGGSTGRRCEDPRCWGRLEGELRFVWWVKVRSPDGWEGWSDRPDHFGNKDACGKRAG